MHRRSRVRDLRAPFIVTVASLGALAGGCGGDAVELTSLPAAVDNPSACPETVPQANGDCGLDAMSCGYGSATTCNHKREVTAHCSDGGWVISDFRGLSCNPPPPDTQATCPTSAPSAGTWCAGEQLVCEYNRDSCGSPELTATCSGGAWSVSHAGISCNPPPPQTCPADAPTHGQPCTGFDYLSCEYGDCYGVPTTTAACENGAWSIQQRTCNPPPPVCPDDQPGDGTACMIEGQSCEYDNPDVYCGQRYATCASGKWQIAFPSCPAPVCPDEAPASGGDCMFPGHSCSYGTCESSGLELIADCRKDGWALRNGACTMP